MQDAILSDQVRAGRDQRCVAHHLAVDRFGIVVGIEDDHDRTAVGQSPCQMRRRINHSLRVRVTVNDQAVNRPAGAMRKGCG
jgi:hypothetical protein